MSSTYTLSVLNEDLLIFCLSLSFYQTLGKNLEVYRMKHGWIRAMKLARATVTTAVVLQVLRIGSGAPCLFVIDLEILWLLPSLMLWMQFALSIAMIPFATTSSVRRPLKPNIVFYGITTVASFCLAVTGIVLHWQLMFVEQYLFLQAMLVWGTYRLSTLIHEILPTKTHDSDNIKTAPGANIVSSRAMNVVDKSTDEN